jgi:hypothetical protein
LYNAGLRTEKTVFKLECMQEFHKIIPLIDRAFQSQWLVIGSLQSLLKKNRNEVFY